MNTYEKYSVTLSCLPEENCDAELVPANGGCVRLYPIFAGSCEDALKKAFALHALNCDQPCGNCEVTTEAALMTDDLVD